MKKLTTILIMAVLFSGAFAGTPKKEVPKGVAVLGTSYSESKANAYTQAIHFFCHYQNNTNKKVIAIEMKLTITNPFGEIVLNEVVREIVNINPKSIKRNPKGWFIKKTIYDNDMFDKLIPMVRNKSIKFKFKVLRVIYTPGIKK